MFLEGSQKRLVEGSLQRVGFLEEGAYRRHLEARGTQKPEARPSESMTPLYMGKMGSICHFPRALPASIWGHCSQVLVFTSTWGTRKGVWQWHFQCCFSQHLGILQPQNTVKQGKRENDKSTLFYPPTMTPFACALILVCLYSGFWSFGFGRNRQNSGESSRPLTPILLKSIAIHLPFLWHTFAKVCHPLGRK